MKRAALILAALAAILTAAAATVRTATENFVTNKIAEAVTAIPPPDYSTNNTELVETIQAKAPAQDLSPFLRNDKRDDEVQTFGGTLSGFSFLANSGWSNYTAYAGSPIEQTLPGYIQSNPWGFLATNKWGAVRANLRANNLGMSDGDYLGITGSDDIAFMLRTEDYGGNLHRFTFWTSYGPTEDDVMRRMDMPTRVSQLTNDAGYLTGYTESDPTVPQWAKAPTKPTYTASEVGAYSTGEVDYILRDYLPLDYFKDGQTIPMYWGDGTKLCDFGANWLGGLVNTVNEKPDDADIPPAVSNIVTTALVRERLGVYLYVGADGGIYVHTNED